MMATEVSEVTPGGGGAHDALLAFVGEWRVEGKSFGGADQRGPIPTPTLPRGIGAKL